MSIKRHLFPTLGALVLIADVPPPGPRPTPDQPTPSTPGCTMRKTSHSTAAIDTPKPKKV
ncbi:MAG: hypothetical protein JNN17_25165 [Verrucomicrobiaceae bacterium]|nr:hypothetical protein [Verrucomicrobiaceae bacterium]